MWTRNVSTALVSDGSWLMVHDQRFGQQAEDAAVAFGCDCTNKAESPTHGGAGALPACQVVLGPWAVVSCVLHGQRMIHECS